MASLLEYTHLSLPEHFDEIGNEILKMYYPSGEVDDNSHLNTVAVCVLTFIRTLVVQTV